MGDTERLQRGGGTVVGAGMAPKALPSSILSFCLFSNVNFDLYLGIVINNGEFYRSARLSIYCFYVTNVYGSPMTIFRPLWGFYLPEQAYVSGRTWKYFVTAYDRILLIY